MTAGCPPIIRPFPEGGLARVHFIIGRSGGKTPKVEQAVLEAAIRDIVRTWDDGLREVALETGKPPVFANIARRFPDSYRNSFSPAEALVDAERISRLDENNRIAIDYYRHVDQQPSQAALKIYHYGSPVALSRRVPILENMGFSVISERTFEVGEEGVSPVFVHDMEISNPQGQAIDLSDGGKLFEEVFLSVWHGDADNDGYNSLAQNAGLRSAELGLLRAYGRYLQQAGIPQSQDFIAAALNRYPEIARGLYALFVARFDPKSGADGEVTAKHLKAKIKDALDDVPNIDDDTIIRRYANLIEASLRTNHFVAETKERGQSLAIKLDSRAIDGLPEPRPWREIFVYGSEVEGVHLRFGPVARGGLRWSDRAQDYRTEVLGLVKAQQVKNAVIVPVGAKGGFFPKRLPAAGSRDAVFEAGKSAYVNFVSSLLSITDNLDGDKVVPPKGLVRRDKDDPYFVVAADKGTATFSDTANGISERHGFWLDDAFASGGSAGYDHKKMGITAKGAWEAVKRHFREMNRDIQTTPFTTVGVGDMSGDVFGNGMLLVRADPADRRLRPSRHLHRSRPGHRGLLCGAQAHVRPAALQLAGLRQDETVQGRRDHLAGAEIGHAVGGCRQGDRPGENRRLAGRDHERHPEGRCRPALVRRHRHLCEGVGREQSEVGDRANDAIRVTAARVALQGRSARAPISASRSAPASSSACSAAPAIPTPSTIPAASIPPTSRSTSRSRWPSAMRKGGLTRPARNKLLAEMTDEVGRLVLANNYGQTLALSLARRRGLADLGHQARFMTILEGRGLLDRAVETLPSPAQLTERAARNEPLTRAELGVLLAYAKIVLFSDIVASDVPDDPHFDRDLMAYFPDRMEKKYAADIHGHRLRREIITRVLSNDLINRGGPAFVTKLQEATGRTPREVVRAFAVVRDGFDLNELFNGLDALDNKIDGQLQLDLYGSVSRLINLASAWDLKNGDETAALGVQIAGLREARRALRPKIAALAPAATQERIKARADQLEAAGVKGDLAARLSRLELSEVVQDIALVAKKAKADIIDAAKAYFAVTEAFRIGRIEDAARGLSPSDYYDGMALSRAQDTIAAARRGMAIAALKGQAGAKAATDPVANWLEAGGERIGRLRDRLQALTEGGDITVSRLSVAAGLMGDLA